MILDTTFLKFYTMFADLYAPPNQRKYMTQRLKLRFESSETHFISTVLMARPRRYYQNYRIDRERRKRTEVRIFALPSNDFQATPTEIYAERDLVAQYSMP